MARLHYPATQRNREPIAQVLAEHLPRSGSDEDVVLEIASGSGEHARAFAERFGALVFQPTDPDAECRASIDAWCGELPNVRPALNLDVRREPWPIERAGAVLCINMIHISPWESCQALMRGARRILPPEGLLYLYGPYRVGGRHTAPSNAEFDASLRARDPAWGVRDVEAVIEEAAASGIAHVETLAMPANNLSLVLRRRA